MEVPSDVAAIREAVKLRKGVTAMQISGLTMRGSNEPQQKPPSLMFSRPGEAGPANRELKQKLQRLLREHDTDLMLVSSSLPDRFTDEGTTVETGRSMLEATVDCLVQVGRFLVVGVHLVGSKALATDQESPARTAASLLANDVAGLTAWPGADHLIDKTWWTAATRGGLKTLVSGTHLASLIDSPQAAQRVMGATQPELGGYMGLLLRAAKHAHAADAPKLLAVLGTLSKQLDATAQQLAKHDLLPDGGLMAPGASSLLFARVLQLCFNVAKAVAQVCGQLRNSGVSTDFLRRLDNGNNVLFEAHADDRLHIDQLGTGVMAAVESGNAKLLADVAAMRLQQQQMLLQQQQIMEALAQLGAPVRGGAM